MLNVKLSFNPSTKLRQSLRGLCSGQQVRQGFESRQLDLDQAPGPVIPVFLNSTSRFESEAKAPARSFVSIKDVGAATPFLAQDVARFITGDTIY